MNIALEQEDKKNVLIVKKYKKQKKNHECIFNCDDYNKNNGIKN